MRFLPFRYSVTMTWINNINNIAFAIKTGDGNTFNPLWKNATKEKEFNVTKYDFINLQGSEIDRKKSQSAKYNLTFYFQGAENITDALSFENSAEDNRLWTITHPIYGTIIGQPVNLKRNDSFFNSTEFTVEFWESLNNVYPQSNISVQDDVFDRVEAIRNLSIGTFTLNSNPVTDVIAETKNLLNISYARVQPDSESKSTFTDKVKKAVKSVDAIVTSTEDSITKIQDAYNQSVNFTTPIRQRVLNIVKIYNDLKTFLDGSIFAKVLFESQAGTLISNMSLISINPDDSDYISRSQVDEINDIVIDTYKDYLKTLDDNQVSIYDVENTYNPDVNIQNKIYEVVNLVTQNLFLIAFDAKQERTIELDKDSNLILLTHRFIGLDASDENIETFREINNIRLDELLNIKKGRLITYYV